MGAQDEALCSFSPPGKSFLLFPFLAFRRFPFPSSVSRPVLPLDSCVQEIKPVVQHYPSIHLLTAFNHSIFHLIGKAGTLCILIQHSLRLLSTAAMAGMCFTGAGMCFTRAGNLLGSFSSSVNEIQFKSTTTANFPFQKTHLYGLAPLKEQLCRQDRCAWLFCACSALHPKGKKKSSFHGELLVVGL